MSLPFRSRVEHAAYPVLERLDRVPRVLSVAVVLALLALGIVVPRVGFVVAVLVGCLIYLTWPRLLLPERLLRLAVLAVVTAVAVVQAFPR